MVDYFERINGVDVHKTYNPPYSEKAALAEQYHGLAQTVVSVGIGVAVLAGILLYTARKNTIHDHEAEAGPAVVQPSTTTLDSLLKP